MLNDEMLPTNRVALNQRPSSVRFGVLVLVAAASSSAYLTRHCIAVANTTIQDELGIDESRMGWVLGAFSAGYFLCQVPGGWLGNRIGTRAALSTLSTLWSLFTIWSAAVMSFVPLMASRMAFGLAQAGLVPNSARIIHDWFPLQKRGIYSATIGASMSIGGAVTMGLTAWLMTDFHWREIFRMYSLVGIVWAIVFYAFFRTRPEQHPWVNEAEISLIEGREQTCEIESSGRQNSGSIESNQQVDDQPVTPAEKPRLIPFRSIGGLCAQSFFRAAGFGLFVSWFPAYLEYRYDVSREQAGTMAMYPLVAKIVGALFGGLLVDFLLKQTGSKRISRCGVAVVALGSCGLLMACSTWTSSASMFVALMSVGVGFSGLGNPPSWTAGMDVGGRHTAVMMGIQNMCGTVGGFTMPVVLGYLIGNIKQTGGDWNLVIYFVAAIFMAGAVCWLAVNPNEEIQV